MREGLRGPLMSLAPAVARLGEHQMMSPYITRNLVGDVNDLYDRANRLPEVFADFNPSGDSFIDNIEILQAMRTVEREFTAPLQELTRKINVMAESNVYGELADTYEAIQRELIRMGAVVGL